MTLLDQALIKTFLHSEPRAPTAGAKRQVDMPHVAVSPAVPPSRATADLAVAPAIPSEKQPSPDQPSVGVQSEARREGHLRPTAAQPSTAPVGPSVAALLDEAFRATALGPSAATLLHEAHHTTTVPTQTASPVKPSAAALLDEAFHVNQLAMESPSPTKKTSIRRVRKVKRVAIERPLSTETDKTEIGKTELDNTTPVSPEASTASNAAATTPPAHTVTDAPTPGETPWRPLLQVDRVVWRGIHERLQTTAAAAIDQIADRLLSLGASGSKTLGMASCASGEGVTTMVLAVARKLVSQGRRIVLVDANWSNPQLAQTLCLLPQFGWEDTLCGGLPLEEVAIESLADGLVVLPARKPPARAIAQSQVATSLDVLAREFDAVLVDLGPLVHVENEGFSSHNVVARMDAVILVQNVCVTTPNRLAEVCRRLVASNLRLSGTIQNAVPLSHDQNSRKSR
jgi:Mrp family chromosome partitioning ATPase